MDQQSRLHLWTWSCESQQKPNFTGYCFEIAMKADTYWTTSTCRHFCKSSTCIISLNTLKISLRQVLLPLFSILVWLSNWTSKVTQLVIGRARIWAQAILPQSLCFAALQKGHFSFSNLYKNRGICIQSYLNEILFITAISGEDSNDVFCDQT